MPITNNMQGIWLPPINIRYNDNKYTRGVEGLKPPHPANVPLQRDGQTMKMVRSSKTYKTNCLEKNYKMFI